MNNNLSDSSLIIANGEEGAFIISFDPSPQLDNNNNSNNNNNNNNNPDIELSQQSVAVLQHRPTPSISNNNNNNNINNNNNNNMNNDHRYSVLPSIAEKQPISDPSVPFPPSYDAIYPQGKPIEINDDLSKGLVDDNNDYNNNNNNNNFHREGYDEKRDAPVMIERVGVKRQNIDGEINKEYYPVFVPIMAIACIVFFIISMYKNDWKFAPAQENPMYGPSAQTLIDMGAKVTYKIQEGEWWRLFAPMVLHAGVIHLLMNMLMLCRTVYSMEKTFGWWRISIIYLISGLFGSLMSAIFMPAMVSIGASGALYGCIGALFGDFFHHHQYMEEGKWTYLLSLILQTSLGLILGLLPQMDNFCHIGGIIAGILSSSIFFSGALRDPNSGRRKHKLRFVITSFILLSAAFLVGFIVLYKSVNAYEYCSWCRYMSCIDTPWWTCVDYANQASIRPQYCPIINGTRVCN